MLKHSLRHDSPTQKESGKNYLKRSWWGTESLTFGRLLFGVCGSAGVVSGIYIMFYVPSILGISPIIAVFFGLPALACGILMLTNAPSQKVTPRFCVFIVFMATVFASGGAFWFRNQVSRMTATKNEIQSMVRTAAIQDFVGRMNLEGADESDMLAKLTDMPDKDLCQAMVLPAGYCRGQNLP